MNVEFGDVCEIAKNVFRKCTYSKVLSIPLLARVYSCFSLLMVYWLGATDYTWNSIPLRIHCKESSTTFLVLSVLTVDPWPAASLPQIRTSEPTSWGDANAFLTCFAYCTFWRDYSVCMSALNVWTFALFLNVSLCSGISFLYATSFCLRYWRSRRS
jgi:hypothetical protein